MAEIWAEFKRRLPPEEIQIARDLHQWLTDEFDEVFPTANAFAPMLDDKSRNQFFFKITYTGLVEIWFVFLTKKKPFSSEDLRAELRLKLNRISGVEIPEDRLGGKPQFPLKLLVGDDALAEFKEIMSWAKSQVRESIDRAV